MAETAKKSAEEVDTDAKRAIAEEVARFVKEKTGKNIGVTGGKAIFDTCVRRIFENAVKDEQFRFPGGFGSLHVRRLNKGTKPKRLPSGQTTVIGEGRVKLRYIEGNEVKGLLGTRKAPKATATETVASA